MNEIGLLEFKASSPLLFDPYARNRLTGSFILIDPLSNATVGAAMIQEAVGEAETWGEAASLAGRVSKSKVGSEERSRRNQHPPRRDCDRRWRGPCRTPGRKPFRPGISSIAAARGGDSGRRVVAGSF